MKISTFTTFKKEQFPQKLYAEIWQAKLFQKGLRKTKNGGLGRISKSKGNKSLSQLLFALLFKAQAIWGFPAFRRTLLRQKGNEKISCFCYLTVQTIKILRCYWLKYLQNQEVSVLGSPRILKMKNSIWTLNVDREVLHIY